MTPDLARIIDAATTATGWTLTNLVGDWRNRHLVETRRVIYWLARTHNIPTTTVATALNRDYTTIWRTTRTPPRGDILAAVLHHLYPELEEAAP